MRGTTYAKGLGTHAVSSIAYALNGSYGTFASDVGVDDEVGGIDYDHANPLLTTAVLQ